MHTYKVKNINLKRCDHEEFCLRIFLALGCFEFALTSVSVVTMLDYFVCGIFQRCELLLKRRTQ